MSEKKFKFNIIDAVVILVVIAVIAFVALNFVGGDTTDEVAEFDENITQTEELKGANAKTYVMSYFFEEVPEFAANMVEKGSAVTNETTGDRIGRLLSVEIGDSVSYGENDRGEIVKSTKEGYKSVAITVEAKAYPFAHGIEKYGVKYVVGHTMTIYAGKAKLYGKISGITEKK